MANWCNGKLIVTGAAVELRRFVRAAAQPKRRARRRARTRPPRKPTRRTARGPVLSFTRVLPLRADSELEDGFLLNQVDYE